MQEDHLQRTTRLQRHCKRIAVPLTFCAAMLITREAALAQQAEETHWVGTWAASPMAPSASDEHSF
ncbi:MAG TPA: hypothetical protein V6C72_19120, partial [Chroococcales cyanobacterium]